MPSAERKSQTRYKNMICPGYRHLREEERCKGDIDNDPFVNSLPNHLAHELKQIKVVVCQVTENSQFMLLLFDESLPKGRGIKSFFGSRAEKVETWVKHLLYCLLQKLFEDAILVNPRLIQSLHIDKAHPDQTLEGCGRE